MTHVLSRKPESLATCESLGAGLPQGHKDIPANELRLADQLRRAADSVALNIAEGNARGSNKEFRKFLEIARGSMKEVEAALALAGDGELITGTELVSILALSDETARTLYGLLRAITRRIESGESERFLRPGSHRQRTPASD